MFFDIVLLLAGFALLVLAGDLLVKGAVGIAERVGISPLIIGLTVVAFGTSAPELFVSLQAALAGKPDIAVGNIVGSNIVNVLLVIGLPALIAPMVARLSGLRRNMTVMLGFTAVLVAMGQDAMIGRLEGTVLAAALFGYVVWQVRAARATRPVDGDYHDEIGEAPHDRRKLLLYIAGGLAGLPIAAQMAVTGASGMAEAFGIPQAVIGLTIVAIGTSLPELATTFMAAWRGSGAVAIGNVVGSNIFNIGFILGLTSLITPIAVDARIAGVDVWIMALAAIVLACLAYFRIDAGRATGAALLVGFAAYLLSFVPGGLSG